MVRCWLALTQKKVPASLTRLHFCEVLNLFVMWSSADSRMQKANSDKFDQWRRRMWSNMLTLQYLPAASYSSDTLTPGAGSKTAAGRSIPIYIYRDRKPSQHVTVGLAWGSPQLPRRRADPTRRRVLSRGKTNLNFSESESFRILPPNPNPNLKTPYKINLNHSSTSVIVQIIINIVVIRDLKEREGGGCNVPGTDKVRQIRLAGRCRFNFQLIWPSYHHLLSTTTRGWCMLNR